MPIELKSENFDAFAPSAKKSLYRWLLRGKLPETRIKRAELIALSARSGKKDIL